MSIEPTTKGPSEGGARLVWVVSSLRVPEGYDERDFVYREKSKRGHMVEVWPNNQKKKIMSFLEASRFLAEAVAPAEPFPDGGFVNPDTGEVERHRFGKPLKIVEFTEDEKQETAGMLPAQAEKYFAEKGKGKPEAPRTKQKAKGLMFEPAGA